MTKFQKCTLHPIGTQYLDARFRYRDTSGKVVAFKRLSLQSEGPNADPDSSEIGVPLATIREISLLKVIEHENLARLEDIEYDLADTTVGLALEYPGMDLINFLAKEPEKARDQKLIKKLLYQLLCGISYLHSMGAAHGNLNHKNVLIDCANDSLKITNLILDMSDYITYKAPELYLGSAELTTATDMFAVGCIFAEMVTRKPLLRHSGNGTEINSIFNLLGTPTEQNWPGVIKLYPQLSQYDKIEPKDLSEKFPSLEKDGVALLSELLCLNPSKRITAVSALNHKYFDRAPAPSSSPTPSLKSAPTPSSSPTPSLKPAPTPSSSPTPSLKPAPTPSFSPTPSLKPAPTPSSSRTLSLKPAPSPSSSRTPSLKPAQSPSSSPTRSLKPAPSPSSSPTRSLKPAPSQS